MRTCVHSHFICRGRNAPYDHDGAHPVLQAAARPPGGTRGGAPQLLLHRGQLGGSRAARGLPDNWLPPRAPRGRQPENGLRQGHYRRREHVESSCAGGVVWLLLVAVRCCRRCGRILCNSSLAFCRHSSSQSTRVPGLQLAKKPLRRPPRPPWHLAACCCSPLIAHALSRVCGDAGMHFRVNHHRVAPGPPSSPSAHAFRWS
jgi:hypothetical protein